MSSSGLTLAERLNVSVPGGRTARVRTGAAARPSPYGTKPNSSSGRLSDREDSKRDIDSQWTHDKFARHNGIEGGELGARIRGNVGRQITSGASEQPSSRILTNAFAGIGGRQEAKNKVTDEPPLAIKGASSTTGVEVEGLAPGTTAEDVAEIFSRCGAITEHRLLSTPNASSVRVFLHFETSQGAQTAVSQFDKQTADGRALHVFTVNAGPLGSRLGVVGRKGPPKGNVDLLADSAPSGGMRSDELIARDPRAKVIVDPSGVNKLLEPVQSKPAPVSHRRGGGGGGATRRPGPGPGVRGGRGGQRGRGGPGRSLSDRMDLD